MRRLGEARPADQCHRPGYFRTEMNQALVDNQEFSAWLEKRTPAGRWGNVDELIGARRLSGLRRLVLRQWPHALCRRRPDGVGVSHTGLETLTFFPIAAVLKIRRGDASQAAVRAHVP